MKFNPSALLSLLGIPTSFQPPQLNPQLQKFTFLFPHLTNFLDLPAAPPPQPYPTSPPFYPSPWLNPPSNPSSPSSSSAPPSSGPISWPSAYAQAVSFVSNLTLLEKVNLTTGVGWQGEQCVGQNGAIPRLGFRSLCMQDSPTGVRYTDGNSVFPAGVNVAATWDRGLMYARGEAMGKEAKGKGVTVLLGPVAGPLGRAPEGGRNWEGFSPDPYLTGVAMAQTIQGMQNHVVACAKHFIGNEQEHFRQRTEAQGYRYDISESLSSNIDDATMHELYLWPFADAVRAGVGSVMCSYNQVNNSYACQNSKLLNNLLKSELGFQGFVMSDWQAQHTGVASAVAGLDMSMPGDTLFNSSYSFWGSNLTLAVLNGTVPQYRIDDMAVRIMAAYFKVGFGLEQPPINFDSWTLETNGPINWAAGLNNQTINQHVNVTTEDHAILIRSIAARSTVLLKNLNNTLPLDNPSSLVVIGSDAGPNPFGANACPDRGCDTGSLATGWGSGTANFPYLITPDSALSDQALADGTNYTAILSDYAYDEITTIFTFQPNATALVFVNADSGEGYISIDNNQGDRNNLTLWHDGDALITHVSSLCTRTIVIIHSPGPVLLPWASSPNISAILWAGLPGQESGNAITDILYGKVNPAAKSPFTWANARQDYGTDVLYEPNNGNGAPQANFTEGIFIDYRAFQRANITPLYEFGFGLSYTTFEYSDLTISGSLNSTYTPTTGYTSAAATFGNFSTDLDDYVFPEDEFPRVPQYIYPYLTSHDISNTNDSAPSFLPPSALLSTPQPLLRSGGSSPGGNAQLYDVLYTVSCTITNTGPRDGEEIAQLYVDLPTENKAEAVTVLRGFERLSIPAGASVRFTADLTRRDLSRWDVRVQDWVLNHRNGNGNGDGAGGGGGGERRVWVGGSFGSLKLSEVLV